MLAGLTLKVLKHQFSVIVEIDSDLSKVIRSGFSDLAVLGHDLAEPIGRLGSNNEIKEALAAYQDKQFDLVEKLNMAQSGSDFAEKVWRGISRIKPGKTMSYAQLANQIGHPKAHRAVGSACGKNNLPIFVPCHRVLPSSGKVGNYAYGPEIKELLLQHELDRHHILR